MGTSSPDHRGPKLSRVKSPVRRFGDFFGPGAESWSKGDPWVSLDKDKSILPEDREDHWKLLDVKISKLVELTTEQNLYDINLSPALPQDEDHIRGDEACLSVEVTMFCSKRTAFTKWVPLGSPMRAYFSSTRASSAGASTSSGGVIVTLPQGARTSTLANSAWALVHDIAHLYEMVVGLNLIRNKLEGDLWVAREDATHTRSKFLTMENWVTQLEGSPTLEHGLAEICQQQIIELESELKAKEVVLKEAETICNR
ncbi:hypothetical protein COCNU_09G005060 [Cocos nucifera]|uniref:Uncharacterized protein n=1 Tax=Cocos nucifera TaxID=13894 RepID=A0A8K0IJX3_COCNU|nr:hypothetical protein COCNU_09G005060 [Cocos nucifera]